MNHEFYNRTVHVPEGFEDGSKPHLLRIDGGWLVMWPKTAHPSRADEALLLAFMHRLIGMTMPQPGSIRYEAHQVLQ